MRLEIRDLSDCLRLLGRKRHRLQREGLREEIVDFIRQHSYAGGSSRPGEPLEIQLS
jgi:hypothetical protein